MIADLLPILQLVRPYRVKLLAAVLLALVTTSLALAMPLWLRALVDTVVRSRDLSRLNWLAAGLIALAVLQVSAGFGGRYLLSTLGERVVADLRYRVYAHLQSLSLDFFASQRTGALMSRLTNDVAAVRDVATSVAVDALTTTLTLVGSLIAVLSVSWRLCLVMAVVVPLATISTRRIGALVKHASMGVQQHLAEATATANEALACVAVVTSFARNDYEVERYGAVVESVYRASRRRALQMALLTAAVTLVALMSNSAIVWYGGSEIIHGRLSIGALLAVLLYAFGIGQAVGSLGLIYASLKSASGASARLFDLLSYRSDIVNAPNALPLPRVLGHIVFERVTAKYRNGQAVIRDLSLEVHPGEMVAIVGPSGAGKTTLLNLIPRLLGPCDGRVLIDGHDVAMVTLETLRRQVAHVSQDVQLFHATVADNIRYGKLDASQAEVEVAAREANAHDFILEMRNGYDTLIGERGVTLSGGQRQRIAIARALLKAAPILLLDEATSALDGESEQLVKDAIDRLRRNRTTLVVAHRLGTVRGADRVVVLRHGTIVQIGGHAQLMRENGPYRDSITRDSASVDGGSPTQCDPGIDAPRDAAFLGAASGTASTQLIMSAHASN